MRKWICLFCLVLAVFSGCSIWEQESVPESDYYFYYIDESRTELVKTAYEPARETTEDMIQEFMKLLNNREHGKKSISLLPEGVEITTHSVHDGVLNLDFNREYLEMGAAREVLARAGVVKTFAQLSGIQYVKFQIDGNPFLDSNEKPIGIMNNDSFLENSGENLNSYQEGNVRLYFASKDGKKLVREDRKVYFDRNVTLENVVVEQLVKGSRESAKATLPADMKVISVTTVDDICYVNLSQDFVQEMLPLQPEIPIYSIVNSLVDTCKVEKVQISVEGLTDITLGETMQLDQFYEKNEELD